MSALLEILLELAFNITSCVLEILFDTSWGGFDLPDTKATRIIMLVIIILLGAILLWELH